VHEQSAAIYIVRYEPEAHEGLILTMRRTKPTKPAPKATTVATRRDPIWASFCPY